MEREKRWQRDIEKSKMHPRVTIVAPPSGNRIIAATTNRRKLLATYNLGKEEGTAPDEGQEDDQHPVAKAHDMFRAISGPGSWPTVWIAAIRGLRLNRGRGPSGLVIGFLGIQQPEIGAPDADRPAGFHHRAGAATLELPGGLLHDFRRGLGDVIETYEEVGRRLGIQFH